MKSKSGQSNRVVSGMRPTGRLHLGHFHGVLKNWVKLQHEYDCYFFVADWHALTTHYESDSAAINDSVWEMVIDWLATGVDPSRATLFIQSRVPEHAELNLLLSMLTPLGWLERVPSYKDQQAKLTERDLSTHGFLGYPVLQAADILLYHARQVPVGEDQVPHIELTREIARRFNFLYGREAGFAEKAEEAIRKLGKRGAKLYRNLRTAYTEQGDHAPKCQVWTVKKCPSPTAILFPCVMIQRELKRKCGQCLPIPQESVEMIQEILINAQSGSFTIYIRRQTLKNG